MDQRRVSLAGNNYSISAFSSEYELGDPELRHALGHRRLRRFWA